MTDVCLETSTILLLLFCFGIFVCLVHWLVWGLVLVVVLGWLVWFLFCFGFVGGFVYFVWFVIFFV